MQEAEFDTKTYLAARKLAGHWIQVGCGCVVSEALEQRAGAAEGAGRADAALCSKARGGKPLARAINTQHIAYTLTGWPLGTARGGSEVAGGGCGCGCGCTGCECDWGGGCAGYELDGCNCG